VSTRDRYLLSVVGGLAAVVALWMVAFSPKLNELKQARKDVDSAKTSYETARQEAQQFAQARLDFPKAYAEMARLGKAVPTHIDEASLVYQLDRAADRAGVKFEVLTLSSDNAAAQGAASAPAPPAPTPGAQAGNQPAAAPTTPTGPDPQTLGSVPANALAAASAPTGATAGAASMRVMHFSFEFTGKFFRLEDFLRGIKRLTWTREGDLMIAGRLMTIDGITFDSDGNKVGMSATAYVLPASQGLFDGATPGGPALTGATPQAASAPASGTPTPTAAVTP
jgi:type II secretion system (T2SS) protein M